MKKIAVILLILICLNGCARQEAQIVATTGTVYQFTAALCQGTPLRVAQTVTESVSCLHDYTLTVEQMKLLESAQVTVVSGAGLEEFMRDALNGGRVIDASTCVPLLESNGEHHSEHEHAHDHGHEHEHDPHIWLSPANALLMVQNICEGLSAEYPQYKEAFQANLVTLTYKILELDRYGQEQLSELRSREMITFHDGFGYLADHYDLTILRAIEEESGSEASAKELIELIGLVREHELPAIFTEANGSATSAGIIARETGAACMELDMAMSAEDWFDAMKRNIDTLKEALG